jgi:hypothetical protein
MTDTTEILYSFHFAGIPAGTNYDIPVADLYPEANYASATVEFIGGGIIMGAGAAQGRYAFNTCWGTLPSTPSMQTIDTFVNGTGLQLLAGPTPVGSKNPVRLLLRVTASIAGSDISGQIRVVGREVVATSFDVAVIQNETIYAEGDSYMAGSYGVVLGNDLRVSNRRQVANSAVGGSSLADIKARILARPSLKGQPMVIWDGSANGFTTPAASLALIDDIITYHGDPSKIVYIPSVNVGPSSTGVPSSFTLDLEAVRDGLTTRGVQTFDPVPLINALSTGTAQDNLDVSARVVLYSQLVDSLVHLKQSAMNIIGAKVTDILKNTVL